MKKKKQCGALFANAEESPVKELPGLSGVKVNAACPAEALGMKALKTINRCRRDGQEHQYRFRFAALAWADVAIGHTKCQQDLCACVGLVEKDSDCEEGDSDEQELRNISDEEATGPGPRPWPSGACTNQ